MASHIALLHSVTIGGSRRLVMAEWRAMMAAIGLDNPRTWVATGNALFDADKATIAQLEHRLEAAFAQSFGRQVDTIVKTAAHWARLVAAYPFPDEAERDGTRIAVRVMRKPLERAVLKQLQPYATQGERLAITHGDLWIHFDQDPTRSRLVNALTTKRLGVGTMRNWNTVRRLGDMIAA
ncbi:DUF1697 domain-containing protein [Sphingomonas asaccharolytica]|uniref:DUF1697 domain-containing protein n=1 Tax=Sphingomonas asaccharolytica TaxID=40681 RepID=UPI000832C691|nr:DUF1697 domain-containing protein [Sphingomonas asaccharolytica]